MIIASYCQWQLQLVRYHVGSDCLRDVLQLEQGAGRTLKEVDWFYRDARRDRVMLLILGNREILHILIFNSDSQI